MAAPPVAMVGGNQPVPFTPTGQFGVYNNCKYPIWLQSLHQPEQDSSLIELPSKQGYSYHVTTQSVPSFTLIPKAGCDADGNNCDIGQSLAPCPNNGCQPPIDSKFEASFNDAVTFFNVSAVDGFTLPFSVQLQKSPTETNPACVAADANKLNIQNCPSSEDLSTPKSEMQAFGQYAFGDYTFNNKSLTNETLKIYNPNTGDLIGCAAPYNKLLANTAWGGVGITPATNYSAALYNEVIMYDAPGSPVLVNNGKHPPSGLPNETCCGTDSSGLAEGQGYAKMVSYCNTPTGPCTTTSQKPQGTTATQTFAAGPITKTNYVKYIHQNTTDVYAWQFDDGTGTRVCNSPNNKIIFVLCP